MVVVTADVTLMLTGAGDVIEPSDGVVGTGSGGTFAAAAAKALLESTDMPPHAIVEKALHIAADICVFSNHQIVVERICSGDAASADSS